MVHHVSFQNVHIRKLISCNLFVDSFVVPYKTNYYIGGIGTKMLEELILHHTSGIWFKRRKNECTPRPLEAPAITYDTMIEYEVWTNVWTSKRIKDVVIEKEVLSL
jgi:hypothetical protein